MPPLSTLDHAVFVAGSLAIPPLTSTPIPTGERATTPPLASTLVFGRRDAVLVDVPTTTAQAEELADRVAATAKRLTHVFITHAHPDHWFGVATLLRRFPEARVVGTAETIDGMAVHGSAEMRAQVWDQVFPDQIGDTSVPANASPARTIDLEGNELSIIGVGHTDTDGTSVLHVPSLDLVVAGDALYNGVHQYLAESAGGGRTAWSAAIDAVEALAPRAVVAGHKDPDLDDDATRVIAGTRAYLQDAEDVLAQEQTPEGFFTAMTAQYPDLLNRGVVWLNAVSLYA